MKVSKTFLEINQHSPDLIYNSSNNIYKNNELPRCVKDFHFFEEVNIMYITLNDNTTTAWKETMYYINPYFWANLGIGKDLGLSILGAVWDIFLTDYLIYFVVYVLG